MRIIKQINQLKISTICRSGSMTEDLSPIGITYTIVDNDCTLRGTWHPHPSPTIQRPPVIPSLEFIMVIEQGRTAWTKGRQRISNNHSNDYANLIRNHGGSNTGNILTTLVTLRINTLSQNSATMYHHLVYSYKLLTSCCWISLPHYSGLSLKSLIPHAKMKLSKSITTDKKNTIF